jgi:hypothetical protein
LRVPVSRVREAAALALALCSLLLGLVHWEGYLPVTLGTLSNPLTLKALSTALWPVLGGGVLAILLGRWGRWPARLSLGEIVVAIVGPARRSALAVGGMLERVDRMLRQWPAASLALLALTLLFGAALLLAV